MPRRTFLSHFQTTSMLKLETFEALEEARRRSHAEPVVFYKHSATCGLSTMTRREVARFHEDARVPVYEVVVQRARPVSNELEQIYGVRHESPQAIVVHRDRAAFHTSHGGVREERLRAAVTDLSLDAIADE